MPSTLGTSTSPIAVNTANSRQTAYAGTNWYAVFHNGTNLVSYSSSDGVSWSGATTIPAGSGPNSTVGTKLLADASGKLYLSWGFDNSGHDWFQVYNAGWNTSGTQQGGSAFSAPSLHVYESGGHVYTRPYANNGSGVGEIFHITDPGASPTLTLDYDLVDPAGGSTISGGSFGLDIVGGATPVVIWTTVANTSPPQLVYFNAGAASPPPGSATFGAKSSSILADTNLDKVFATVSEPQTSPTNLHLVYHITGTGWYETVYDGTTWVAGSLLSVMTNNDTSPTIMCDALGTLHLFWCKYNGANDYGIGHATRSGGSTAGGWTAQTDVVAHNSTNRANVSCALKDASSNVLLLWQEGTGSPYNIVGVLVSTAGGGGGGGSSYAMPYPLLRWYGSYIVSPV